MLTVDSPVEIHDAPLDLARLSAFLIATIPGLHGPPQLFQFSAGHSNLTYLVAFGDRELVVKCAPPGARIKSANDMGREYHMISKLESAYPYAPRALAYCDDPSVVGNAFCVTERSRGVIVRQSYPEGVGAEQIGRQFGALIDALADLHALDVAAIGLADFGRPAGYRRRQVEGWAKRLAAARTDDALDFASIEGWLLENLPNDPEIPAVVHNDFKLDNLVWEPADITQLKTVLDWEMSTVGDGAFDLACTLSFWMQADDPAALRAIRAMPSALASVPTRRAAFERYARRTGRTLPSLQYLLAFGFFRRAVIEQQKHFRYRRGDTADPRFANLAGDIGVLRETCLAALAGKLG
jgi:aminoglycoside phosphotransferase (APT) family kinase protein